MCFFEVCLCFLFVLGRYLKVRGQGSGLRADCFRVPYERPLLSARYDGGAARRAPVLRRRGCLPGQYVTMNSSLSGPTAVADVIKDLDSQIALIGPGPHNPKQKQDLEKLNDLKAKAQQIMNQFGPAALINLTNFPSIKPDPSSTPPPNTMANSTAVVKIPGTPGSGGRMSPEGNQVLSKKKLQDLVREIDPNEQLDEDVEEMLLQIADDFIESVVSAACQLARHRKSNTLEVKDVQLHLERQWNMWIPGFGSDEIRPYKKACTTEAHKQRMALIRKTTKK